MSGAIVLIEVLDAKRVPARLAVKAQQSAACTGGTGNCLASGRRLPGCYRHDRITLKLHRFRFESPGMVADPALRICNARFAEEPVRDRIAPHIGLAGLIRQLLQHLLKSRLIHASSERLPLLHEPGGRPGAVVVRVVKELDDSLARM